MSSDIQYTVLLIEPDKSLRRLIALGLHQRGMQVVEAGSLATLTEQPIASPDLLVVDLDSGAGNASLNIIAAHPYLAALPIVVLAWEPPANPATTMLPLRESLAKPFDARALHATVENMLITSASIARQGAQQVFAPVALTPSASLSPLLTAGGLLLIVIGLMLNLLVAGVGVLVTLVALLWWTLGKRPEPTILPGEPGQKYA